ncbi:MAG: hypothetical protein OXM88_12850 [bacterium]|nr:hypothetical protein [bacterium]
MLILLEGPAGGGKSQIALMLADDPDVLIADVTRLWSAVGGYERPYPIRSEDDPALAAALYVQATVARYALRQGLDVVVTTSRRGQQERWQELADEAGTSMSVQTVDPGEQVVRDRLAVDGVLSDACEGAIGRWYG